MNRLEKIKLVLDEFLKQIIKEVKERAQRGEGREMIGDVINRPEDIEIGIDRVGEDLLEELVKKYSLNVKIFSEPDGRDIENGDSLDFYGSIDPFDGSVLYLRGFEHNWYSALSFFDTEKNPLITGIADILNEKLYFSDEKGNYLLDLKSGERKEIFPSKRKDLRGPVIIASYLMSWRYAKDFLDNFQSLIERLGPKALLYPQGGSFIYAFLASGLIDAYVMFNEPRSEIDPGFAIAKRAGCEVVSVSPDGSFREYHFLPGKQHDKVDLLIAASTPELRNEIIKYYLKSNGK